MTNEMKNIKVEFKILPDGTKTSFGHQFVQCHLLLNIKMEDFRHKTQLFAGGHMTNAQATVTYASAISRETVRKTLFIAAFNDLEVKSADILNAYVHAPVTEKV